MSDNALGKVQGRLKLTQDTAAVIKAATDRYTAGGIQDALDIIRAIPDDQKEMLLQDAKGKNLATRIVVALNGNAGEVRKFLGLKE